MGYAGVFPGQGSQSVGMGRFLFDNFPSVRHLFEEASDTLKQDFRKLCFDGPEDELTLTSNTQPALVLVSTATFHVINEVKPTKYSAFSGHSVGEYAAMVAAGSLTLPDALRAVRTRGQVMQAAVPVGHGAMLAVLGLSTELVEKLCQWTQERSGFGPLEVANDNSPGQVVISGSAQAADWLRANFKAEEFHPEAKRVKLIPLNVSAPFHCSLMKTAEEKMKDTLNTTPFKDANTPVVQNFTATAESKSSVLRENLVRQVSGKVRWVECAKRLKELNAQTILELGSGKVLAGLMKKIDPEYFTVINFNSLNEIKAFEKL